MPVKTDLDLEGLKTDIAGALDECRGVLDVNAACIGRHCIGRVGIHEMAQRLPVLPREQIPKGDIQSCDNLSKRTPFTALQRQDMRPRGQKLEKLVGPGKRKTKDERGNILSQKIDPVLGCRRRPVAKHLSPTEGPILIFDPNEGCGAVSHDAEGRLNRYCDRTAKSESLDPGN
ncbi:MAG: hypothetical protein RIA09_01795 [Hoeflea sp.]